MAKRIFGSTMEMLDFFKETGRQGGKKAARKMPKAARVARAKKAAAARWASRPKASRKKTKS